MSGLFTDEQRAALGAVLDEIIPPSADGKLPGAGQIGLVVHVERGLAQMAALVPMVQHALAQLDEIARRSGAASFAGVARGERGAMLAELVAAQPGFLGPIVFHTYVNYYQQPPVLTAIGLEARPPHPRGHELEPGDFGPLDAVRRRGPIWRPTDRS